ncbi:hypothetical protein O9992_27165 [Vibrio lentus]|nr:hypothetical protein [Vibrio lentus]
MIQRQIHPCYNSRGIGLLPKFVLHRLDEYWQHREVGNKAVSWAVQISSGVPIRSMFIKHYNPNTIASASA